MNVRLPCLALGLVPVLAAAPAFAESTDSPGNAPPSAPAAEATSVEPARAHFTRGVQFYNNGDYKLSLLEFRRSYELSRNYRVLYNIGQVNQQLSNYAKALAALEQYLEQGGADVPEPRRVEVTQSVAELKKKIATLKLVFNVDRAEVLLDDLSLGTVAHGLTVTVDAGDHRIEARRSGHDAATTSVSLAAGEAKTVELTLPARRAATQVALTPRSQALPEKSNSGLLWAGWITTGVLAAGAGVSGFLATSHANELASLRNSPDSSSGERQREADQARAYAIASDALTGAAVLAGAASLYFTLSSKTSSPERSRESATRVNLSPFGVSVVHRY